MAKSHGGSTTCCRGPMAAAMVFCVHIHTFYPADAGRQRIRMMVTGRRVGHVGSVIHAADI